MSIFYEAFERERASDIKHHGVKGMRWGVRNQKVYVPVGERREQESQNPRAIYTQEDLDRAVNNVRNSSNEKVGSTWKKVAKGLAIGVGSIVILGGLGAGGMLLRSKLRGRTDFGSTPEGEALRQKVEGGAV